MSRFAQWKTPRHDKIVYLVCRKGKILLKMKLEDLGRHCRDGNPRDISGPTTTTDDQEERLLLYVM